MALKPLPGDQSSVVPRAVCWPTEPAIVPWSSLSTITWLCGEVHAVPHGLGGLPGALVIDRRIAEVGHEVVSLGEEAEVHAVAVAMAQAALVVEPEGGTAVFLVERIMAMPQFSLLALPREGRLPLLR